MWNYLLLEINNLLWNSKINLYVYGNEDIVARVYAWYDQIFFGFKDFLYNNNLLIKVAPFNVVI